MQSGALRTGRQDQSHLKCAYLQGRFCQYCISCQRDSVVLHAIFKTLKNAIFIPLYTASSHTRLSKTSLTLISSSFCTKSVTVIWFS